MIKQRILVLTASLFINSYSQALPLQNTETVTAAVEEFLQNQASSYSGSASIHVSEPTIRKHTACEELQPYLPSAAKLRSRMTVSVRCLAPQTWTLRVKAEVIIEGYYYVSNRTLDVGQTISLDDLVPREGDLLRLPNNVITDPSLAIGHITTQRISSGSTIKSNALRGPQSIERGQSIRTVAHGTGFTASGEGVALQNGSLGNQIQVRVSSGKVVSGTVLDAQTVQVF